MRKKLLYKGLLLLCSFSLILLTACASKGITPPAGAEVKEDLLTVTLEENPTTGYMWNHTFDKEGILELQNDDYTPTATSDKVVGSGGNHSWIFKGIAEGKTVLTFKYYRPWEKADTATETRTFTVTVAKDGRITSVK